MNIPKGWELFFRNNYELVLRILNIIINNTTYESLFPKPENVFKILRMIEPQDIKVVIVNTNPYYTACPLTKVYFANGIAFSIPTTCKIIPGPLHSLVANTKKIVDTSLLSWINQGVCLINTAFTISVHDNNLKYHIMLWKEFTALLLRYITSINQVPCVLIGDETYYLQEYITSNRIIKLSKEGEFLNNLHQLDSCNIDWNTIYSEFISR